VIIIWIGIGNGNPPPTEEPSLETPIAAAIETTPAPVLEESETPPPNPTRTQPLADTQPPTNTPASVLGIGSTQISSIDGMVMVSVPAGEFEMGSESGDSDESPVHSVYLDAFWIDQTEVTNAMFAAFLNEQGNQSEGGTTWLDADIADALIEQSGGQWAPKDGFGDHPVVEVTWYGVRAYCQWAGRRLPTEAEWEKAARGEDSRTYPWGEYFDCQKGNFDDEIILDIYVVPGGEGCDGYEHTAPVGSFPDGASPYGALDMAGNTWEWVAD
jgi:formylglycine-generating enzyme required for sulfatase activity